MAITLKTINDAVSAKYGSYDIDLEDGKAVVSLLNPARLSKEDRKALTELGGKKEDGEEAEELDETDRLTKLVHIVAEETEQADRLLAALSPNGFVDLAMLAEVVSGYMEGQKVGEASPSQD